MTNVTIYPYNLSGLTGAKDMSEILIVANNASGGVISYFIIAIIWIACYYTLERQNYTMISNIMYASWISFTFGIVGRLLEIGSSHFVPTNLVIFLGILTAITTAINAFLSK